MKIIKLLSILFIGMLILTSCDPDPIETVSELGLIKTAVINDTNSDGFAQIGETITYTFTVKNTGDNTISNIVIDDERIGVTALALVPASLTSGQEASISYEYVIAFSDMADSAITNQATVSGEDDTATHITDLSSPTSYEDDSDTVTNFEVTTNGPYAGGYFITNEGNFGSGNGSLTYVSNSGTVTQNAYQAVNGNALGDTVQSIFFSGQNAYIVVNNSNKIVVANRYTLEYVATIEGDEINNPRYFVAVGSTGYVSNWGSSSDATDDTIVLIDLNSNTVTGTISVGEGPEDMLTHDEKVYVNLQGGWGQNNQVLVIDTATNTVLTSIEVFDVPNSITLDGNGNIWVLSGGTPSWTGAETHAKLQQIRDDALYSTDDFYMGLHPEHLTYTSGKLYYSLNGKVYSRGASVFAMTDEVVGLDGYYYGLKAHNGKLYTLDAVDFSSEGSMKIFNTVTEMVESTLTTGIIPGSLVFNQ